MGAGARGKSIQVQPVKSRVTLSLFLLKVLNESESVCGFSLETWLKGVLPRTSRLGVEVKPRCLHRVTVQSRRVEPAGELCLQVAALASLDCATHENGTEFVACT